MPDFHVFTLFVAFNTVLMTLLALNVSRVRIGQRIPNGDGNSVPLKKAIRAHANGVEQVILFALVLLALTYQAKSPELLMALAGAFSVARLAHALGMLVIAAGVEQAQDLPLLEQLGFDGMTGPGVKRTDQA